MTNQKAIDIIKTAIAQVEWDYPKNYAAAFDMAIKALENGWISVEDRLPEPPAHCLVYSAKASRPKGMETATYTKLGWIMATYFPEVTHWMPLPELPKENS